MKILGMMSGTSYDGIDSALCEIKFEDDEIQIQLLAFDSAQYSPDLRNKITDAMPPQETSMEDVCILDTLIGQTFADAAVSIIEKSGIKPDLIVSHGQTLFHWIDTSHKAAGTLQLGEPTWIAEQTGIQVLSNIRSRDITAGGHGAPLVSILDHLMLSGSDSTQGALNLGGISNITVTSKSMTTVAYDIGPANGLMDAAILTHSKGEISFDKDGLVARSGKIDGELLNKFLAHPYYKLPAPKSTGKEIFHLPYLIEHAGPVSSWVIADLLATLLELTVETVALEVEKHNLATLFVAGGGTSNLALMSRLQSRLTRCKVLNIAELGISSQSKEGIAFALIGFLTAHGLPGQIPSCTGAQGPRILGSLTPGVNGISLPDPLRSMPNSVRII